MGDGMIAGDSIPGFSSHAEDLFLLVKERKKNYNHNAVIRM